MKKYDNYKDSGVEWIGDIPSHWIIYRIDWVTKIVRGNTAFKKDELLDDGEYVALQYGKTYKVDVVDNNFRFFVNSEFFNESQIASSGDTILISTSETIEDLGHTCFYKNQNIGLIGGEQILLKPNLEFFYEKYLYHYSRQFGSELKRYAKGLKVFRFSTNDLKRLFIAIPPIEEQTAIANYLDCKTAQIDDLIAKKEQFIQLLEEERVAVINQAVTKGLDPNVSMKDSGIEWLGKIPEHWKIKRLKNLISKKIDNRGKTPPFGEEGRPMLEVKQIMDNKIYPSEEFEKYSKNEDLVGYLRDEVQEGDVLIATVGATAGKCCIVPFKFEFFIAQNVIGFRCNNETDSLFFYYMIESTYFKDSLFKINKSNTIDNLKVSVFINNECIVPPLEEQKKLSKLITDRNDKVIETSKKLKREIELLKEYKTALINEVVTGKVDVREAL